MRVTTKSDVTETEPGRQLDLLIWLEVYDRETERISYGISRELERAMGDPKRTISMAWVKAGIAIRMETEARRLACEAAVRGTLIRWSILRQQIWERDGGICYVCKTPADQWYDCGHIVDRFCGGSDRPCNLVVMCEPCNQIKPLHTTRAEFEVWVESGEWMKERSLYICKRLMKGALELLKRKEASAHP